MAKKRALYACLFGNYETSNELNDGSDGAVDRLYFTDDTMLKLGHFRVWR